MQSKRVKIILTNDITIFIAKIIRFEQYFILSFHLSFIQRYIFWKMKQPFYMVIYPRSKIAVKTSSLEYIVEYYMCILFSVFSKKKKKKERMRSSFRLSYDSLIWNW